MDTGQQIEQYFEALAHEFDALRVTAQYHVVITGGAYLLLQQGRKYTEDIDFALITEVRHPKPNQIFRTTIQREEISSTRSRVPYAREFKQAVERVAIQYHLPLDWLNDEAAAYYYDDAPEVDVELWRSFGKCLLVYLPTAEYVFATKMMAYRPKDQDDIKLLIQWLDIRSKEEAQRIIDRYITLGGQQFYEIRKKLRRIFR